MSTIALIRKPLTTVRRTRRVRDSWSAEERSRRADLAGQGLSALVSQIMSKSTAEDIWAIGSLTPDDLRRLSA